MIDILLKLTCVCVAFMFIGIYKRSDFLTYASGAIGILIATISMLLIALGY